MAAYRMVALTAAAGLLVGAATGAYGWEQRRDSHADALARSTVDIRARAAVFSTGDAADDEISMSVRTFNEGAYPVTVTALGATDDRLDSVADDQVDAAPIPPGGSSVAVVHYRVTCARDALGSVTGEAALRARVRTVDGAEHDADVEVSAYGGSFDGYLSAWCTGAELPSFQQVALDVVRVEQVGDDALAATVELSSSGIGGAAQLEVLQVGSRSAAFRADWDGSVTQDPASGRAWLVATWSVRECTQATTADTAQMALDVTGRLSVRNPSVAGVLAPTDDLAAELVRLTERVCA